MKQIKLKPIDLVCQMVEQIKLENPKLTFCEALAKIDTQDKEKPLRADILRTIMKCSNECYRIKTWNDAMSS